MSVLGRSSQIFGFDGLKVKERLKHKFGLHRQQPESKKIADDYLGDMDLPSSESESDEDAPVVVREEKKDIIRMGQVSLRV